MVDRFDGGAPSRTRQWETQWINGYMDYFKLYAGHGHVAQIEFLYRFVNGIITKGI